MPSGTSDSRRRSMFPGRSTVTAPHRSHLKRSMEAVRPAPSLTLRSNQPEEGRGSWTIPTLVPRMVSVTRMAAPPPSRSPHTRESGCWATPSLTAALSRPMAPKPRTPRRKSPSYRTPILTWIPRSSGRLWSMSPRTILRVTNITVQSSQLGGRQGSWQSGSKGKSE